MAQRMVLATTGGRPVDVYLRPLQLRQRPASEWNRAVLGSIPFNED